MSFQNLFDRTHSWSDSTTNRGMFSSQETASNEQRYWLCFIKFSNLINKCDKIDYIPLSHAADVYGQGGGNKETCQQKKNFFKKNFTKKIIKNHIDFSHFGIKFIRWGQIQKEKLQKDFRSWPGQNNKLEKFWLFKLSRNFFL